MKTTKLVSIFLLGLFLINFVSASDTYTVRYKTYEDGDLVEKITYKVDRDFWENKDRQPTYNYRHGYTYRTTKEYFRSRIENDRRKTRDYYKNNHNSWGNLYDLDEGPTKKYEYVPYLDMYEEKECYTSAPKGKFFYIKC
jgi:hypothetical protein